MGMRHVPSAAWGGSITGGRWREARRKRDGGPELVSGAPAALGPLSSPVGIRFGFEGCPGFAHQQDPGLKFALSNRSAQLRERAPRGHALSLPKTATSRPQEKRKPPRRFYNFRSVNGHTRADRCASGGAAATHGPSPLEEKR